MTVDASKDAKRKMLESSHNECHAVLRGSVHLNIDVSEELVRHAMVPLADTPFLDCMAHMPAPGMYLPISGQAVGPSETKRKKKKSAGKKGTAK